jgi:hypothetical protein
VADDNDDLDLNTLNDEDLVLQVHDDLYNGMKPEIEEATRILLGRGWSPDRVLNDALVEGMRIVGIDFRDGILFVPDRHGQGRHPRHRQEPGRDDDGGRRLRGDRPRHQQPGGEIPRGPRAAQARHPGPVRAADDDDAVHEGGRRHAEGKGHPRRGHRARRGRAAQRDLRQGRRRRRLLPRRRGRRRDREVADRRASRPGRGAGVAA